MLEKFHLVYNSDDNYLKPTFVSAASALERTRDVAHLVVDVLDCGISNTSWSFWERRLLQQFPNVGGVCRHIVDCERISKFKSWRGSVATYARILTPEILSNLDKCLFVDGDTLFVADVCELELIFDGRYWIQGSVDEPDGGERAASYRAVGLLIPKPYVCCGLMLMNLKALRENGFVEKCFDFLSRYTTLPTVDQEGINCVAAGHIAELPPEWGVFNNAAFRDVPHPKCLHYVASKPWNVSIGWTKCFYPFEQLWWIVAERNFGMTPEKDVSQEKYREYKSRMRRTAIVRLLSRLPGRFHFWTHYFPTRDVWRQMKFIPV